VLVSEKVQSVVGLRDASSQVHIRMNLKVTFEGDDRLHLFLSNGSVILVGKTKRHPKKEKKERRQKKETKKRK